MLVLENKPEAVKLSDGNVYELIFAANAALDDADAPDTGRVLVVTPQTLLLMKTAKVTADDIRAWSTLF